MEKPRLTYRRSEKIREVAHKRQQGVVVVLQDIHDPHNAAAVYRSCEAFGVQNIYLIFEKEAPFNPRRIGKSSSSSANKWLDFRVFRSTKDCFAELKQQGYMVIAAALDPKAKTILTADFLEKRIAMVFGNEHRGLSEESLEFADEKVSIPMSGMVQSLNLSVTAGIFLYEAFRQRTASGKNFRLNKVQIKQVISSFSNR